MAKQIDVNNSRLLIQVVLFVITVGALVGGGVWAVGGVNQKTGENAVRIDNNCEGVTRNSKDITACQKKDDELLEVLNRVDKRQERFDTRQSIMIKSIDKLGEK